MRFWNLFSRRRDLPQDFRVLEATSREHTRQIEELEADVVGLRMSLQKLRGRVTGGIRLEPGANGNGERSVNELNELIRQGGRPHVRVPGQAG